jgi:hypothetical protein
MLDFHLIYSELDDIIIMCPGTESPQGDTLHSLKPARDMRWLFLKICEFWIVSGTRFRTIRRTVEYG